MQPQGTLFSKDFIDFGPMSKYYSCGPACRLLGYILCFCYLGDAQLAFAQDVRGTVRDSEGYGLAGVHVAIPSLERGVVTDAYGRYEVENLAAGDYTILFSYIGYQTESKLVRIVSQDISLNVVLVPDILQAEEVLIEEEKVDELTRDVRSVSVLDPEDLIEVRGQTLGETLKELPGVTVSQTGPSISKPVVRGLHSQRVLVLNAGVSQEGQQWGGEHAPEIDPFAPIRIQVIKGVSGVEYGVGAIGGVIRLDPLDLPYIPGAGVGGAFSLNGFSNNLQGAGSLYLEGAARSVPGLGWRIQSSYRKAGDAQTPDYIIRNSAFQEFNGSASLGLRRDRLNLVALYSRFSTELGIYSGSHIGNIDDLLRAIERDEPAFIGEFGYDIGPPKQEIAHNLISIHGDYRLASGSWLEAQYGFQINKRQEFDTHSRTSDETVAEEVAAFDLELVSNTLELKFHHKPVGRLFGSVGINGKNQLNKNGATGFLVPNFRALSGGVFARESWVKDGLTFEAGVRFDYKWVQAWPRENGSRGAYVKRVTDYASLSGVLGSIWQFSPQWSIGVNLGSGWRPPGVNELYNFGVHHGTAQFEIGNPDLERERSIGLDATLRHSSNRTRVEISAYNNLFNGFIFLFPEPEPRVTIRGTFPSFRYKQADALLRGFEASLEHDLIAWLMMQVQVSMVHADNLDEDEPLINMPSDRASIKTRFNLPAGDRIQNTHIDFEGVFVRKQTRVPAGADYMDPPDGYVLFNAGISTSFMLTYSPLVLSLELHNVLNAAYRDYLSRFRYFIDDPGRSLILRIQVPLGKQ